MLFKFSIFKKLLLLTVLFELIGASAKANPGDTTWVTIYNLRKLTYYGDYDTTATLPSGKRYRKIRLHYILGRYACPSGSQYCGSWDYTTQVFAKPQNNDTVEIARVITPYATDWLQTNRKHDYVMDVTDYAPVLEGNMGFKFRYEGYSFGFTITLKLELIEGVPPMDAIKIKNIYNGYYAYGKTSDSIEKKLIPKTLNYASPAAYAVVKNTVSGHGADDANCAEFCSKYYQLKLNASQMAQYQIWRNNCGVNDVYPQTGTWLYERANWCPGAVVWPVYHNITFLTSANTSFSVDIDMQPYTAPNQSNATAGYNFVSQLVSYSAPNHSLDVSIEDIISPTKNENYFRSNPACNNPVITIKNVGTDTITSVVFNYGLKNTTPLTYTWTGSLNYLDQTNVTFPPSLSIYTNNIATDFEVSITSVNGNSGDNNSFNNTYISKTAPVQVFPKDFWIITNTNKSTDPITQKNETTWTISDENGNVIVSKNNMNNFSMYTDTIQLLPGCYKFKVEDSGCDGFSWWAYQYYTPNPGNGMLRFNYPNSNSTFFSVNGDFGCNVIKYFRVANTTSIGELVKNENLIEMYPNPVVNELLIRFNLDKLQSIHYKIIDIEGKIVQEDNRNKVMLSLEKIDVTKLINGVYIVSVQLNDGTSVNKKLVIQK